MRSTRVEFVGADDAVLCDCGADIRLLQTWELGDLGELYISRSFAYAPSEETVSVEDRTEEIVVSRVAHAAPFSMGMRAVRASADCWACDARVTYHIEFDGNVIVSLEPVRG